MKVLADLVLRTMSALFNALYAEGGYPSIAPGRLPRASLLQCLFSIRSERAPVEHTLEKLLMPKNTRVAAVVVWFNPKISFTKNILTYANYVDHTYIVDNSPEDHSTWIPTDNKHISYLWLGGNCGIAHALNLGCKVASEEGHQIVLTMDQDSSFDVLSIKCHLEQSLAKLATDKIAIIGTGYKEINPGENNGFEEASSVITSGNLLKVAAWRDVDGFYEKLFIDQVDHDFCYRLRRKGYSILRNSSIQLNHFVGEPKEKKILGYIIRSTNHGTIRRYYQMRNALYLRKEYPEFAKPLPFFIRDIIDKIIGILILEKDVINKYIAMLYGVLDFYRGNFGSWEYARRVTRIDY